MYHQKHVRVVGFLNIEFENDAIYLHHDDFEFNISKNSIGIISSTKSGNPAKYKTYNNKYVFVEGTFNMNAGGYNGAIDSIVRLKEVKPSVEYK